MLGGASQVLALQDIPACVLALAESMDVTQGAAIR